MSASDQGAASADAIETEAIVRQAEATERLADAVEEQNRLIQQLVDTVAHGGRL